MPLWGATDADESKPKHLTTAQKKEVYANASGWVVEAGSTQSGNGNTSATPEVLVALGSLATSLGSADITEIDWITIRQVSSGSVVMNERLDKFLWPHGWVEMPCAGIFEVKDGEIILWRDYFDLPTYTNQLPKPPDES